MNPFSAFSHKWLARRVCSFAYLSLTLYALAASASASALAAEGSEASSKADVATGEPSGTLAPLTQVLTGEAREAYDAARLLFSDGDYRGASAKFQRAYELHPDPRLLWNTAACEKEQRNYARASQLIERYLEEGGERLAKQSRENAEQTLRALQGFSSRVSLRGVPDGARILVDGSLVATAPLGAPLRVDLGKRILRVEAPGYKPFLQELSVPGNTEMEVEVTLKPAEEKSQLSVVTTGGQDTIRIDGRFVGEGRFTGSLAPGAHRLTVTALGKNPFETDLVLAPGQTRTLQVTLEDAKKKPLWPWLAGGAIVVAGASLGGYFLLSDRGSEATGPSGSLGGLRLNLIRPLGTIR